MLDALFSDVFPGPTDIRKYLCFFLLGWQLEQEMSEEMGLARKQEQDQAIFQVQLVSAFFNMPEKESG